MTASFARDCMVGNPQATRTSGGNTLESSEIRMTLTSSGHDVVDLDQDPVAPAASDYSADCGCGARRTILRHNAMSPCAGRALAKLKAAHPDEYAGYLAALKAEALSEFEVKWQRHLAGDHSPR